MNLTQKNIDYLDDLQDGREICSSVPIYGEGNEAGNEAGYIVGMSTCYPKPGTMKISEGEILTLVSNYSSTQQHTGVMGLFYILVANSAQQYNSPVDKVIIIIYVCIIYCSLHFLRFWGVF